MPAKCLLSGLSASLLAIAAAGCGRMVPVEGTVTLDGNPVAQATIVFLPQETGLKPANALTDEHGRFELETVKRKGAVPGRYQVTVSKKVDPPGAEPLPPNMEPNPENLAKVMSATFKKVQSIPDIYTKKDKTPLEIEVPKGGKKDVRIDLRTN